jgi:putative ABC transport system ATP-binding protein
MTTTTVLELVEVSRTHGAGATAVEALRAVSLTVAAGELVAVMGPSGSGKSTLLGLAGGLDTPTRGAVLVEGVRIDGLRPRALAALRRRAVGYVFQDLNLIPSLTAAENVALPRELDGERARVARDLALVALEEVGIRELAGRFPDDLSGGQQQRVAIARAIVGDRRLILADEPTGALDSQTGEDVLRVLRGRCDAGAAGVLVTHEARHAAWADRVVFLRDGRMVDESGPGGPRRDPARGPERRMSVRVLLRIARRDVLRARGRSLLVLAMVALPVFGLAGFLVLLRTQQLDTDERLARRLGRADAALQATYRPNPIVQEPESLHGFSTSDREVEHAGGDVRPLLPEGSRVLSDTQASVRVETDGGRTRIDFREVAYADPLLAGLVRPQEGRAPRTAGEVAVTPALLAAVGARIGDRLTVVDPGPVVPGRRHRHAP